MKLFILISVIIVLLIVWMFIELINAPLVDDNENIIEEKNETER